LGSTEQVQRLEFIQYRVKVNCTAQLIFELEADVFYYLQQFVLDPNAEDLQAFLQFVTGATDLPSSGITVSFFGTTPSARHIVAHTCSNAIDISTAYSSVQEFKREMLMMLHSENSTEFSAV